MRLSSASSAPRAGPAFTATLPMFATRSSAPQEQQMDISNIGGIFSAVLNVASMFFPQLAMLSSLTNMVTKAFGEGAKGAIDQLVKEYGMPKFLADLAKTAVDNAVGDAQKESTPESDAAAQTQAGDATKSLQDQVQQNIVSNAVENMKAKKGKGSGSWLEALAAALGEAANKQADLVKSLSDAITGDGKDQPKAMTDLQAASQRLSFMMNAIDQVIKTIGEALATAARKQ
jgi:flagellar hook-basal body complex protein FliE